MMTDTETLYGHGSSRWRRCAMAWFYLASGSWVAILYYALFGFWGAFAIGTFYVGVAALVGAYVLGTESVDG